MPESMDRPASTALMPSAQSPDAAAIRARNRRLATNNTASASATSLLSTGTPSPPRGASPIPSARIGSVTGRNNGTGANAGLAGAGGRAAALGGGFGSWVPSWSSVQDFASQILTGGGADEAYGSGTSQPGSRDVSRARKPRSKRHTDGLLSGLGSGSAWGPEPSNTSRPNLDDVAAGSLAEREAALKAVRTASVLESHEFVNGGLDVAGKFKKRRSDEDLRRAAREEEQVEDYLVYIHHVRPEDTYAGIVLRYRCMEDAFRKANGLWSRDNIQTRKWLALPVDACEVRGRPCAGPSFEGEQVDLLAPTPDASEHAGSAASQHDFFASTSNGKLADPPKPADDEGPWTHVRWVTIDTSTAPVEIGRVARSAIGYFPPRRKKSLHTTSSISTPRGSIDVPGTSIGSEAVDSPTGSSSRRHSLLSGRPPLTSARASTPTGSRSRVHSGGDDLRPAWMRRPGGVGSMGRNVRAPGPAKDYFNSWAKKHMPSLNNDSLPSMSVMGSETARFAITADEQGGIVESPFGEGQNAEAASRQGSGLDKAALVVETWLRGAFAKRPGTPILGPRGRQLLMEEGDLIELADTNSDDGRANVTSVGGGGEFPDLRLSPSRTYGSGRSDGDAVVRGRTVGSSAAKDKKAD